VVRSPRSDAKFCGLYEQYFAAMRNYCIRRLPLSEVNDAVAEVFLVVWRRISEVPEGDQARLWLYGVARNVTRNALRSARRRARLDGRLILMRPQSGFDPEMQVIRRSEDNEVLEALAELRPADQELLRLSIWEELTNTEIATVLAIDAHAATMRLKRARDRLAKKLVMTEDVSKIKGRSPTRR
jgi:RNA polymerase sigma-70 factor (ECF subfamily)